MAVGTLRPGEVDQLDRAAECGGERRPLTAGEVAVGLDDERRAGDALGVGQHVEPAQLGEVRGQAADAVTGHARAEELRPVGADAALSGDERDRQPARQPSGDLGAHVGLRGVAHEPGEAGVEGRGPRRQVAGERPPDEHDPGRVDVRLGEQPVEHRRDDGFEVGSEEQLLHVQRLALPRAFEDEHVVATRQGAGHVHPAGLGGGVVAAREQQRRAVGPRVVGLEEVADQAGRLERDPDLPGRVLHQVHRGHEAVDVGAVGALQQRAVDVGAHEVVGLPEVLAGPQEGLPGRRPVAGFQRGRSRAPRHLGRRRPGVVPGRPGRPADPAGRGQGFAQIGRTDGGGGERATQLAVVRRVSKEELGRVSHGRWSLQRMGRRIGRRRCGSGDPRSAAAPRVRTGRRS